MKATEYRFQLLVTVETVILPGNTLDATVDKIRERIKDQVAGHRTSERLVDRCEVDFSRIVYEGTRELP